MNVFRILFFFLSGLALITTQSCSSLQAEYIPGNPVADTLSVNHDSDFVETIICDLNQDTINDSIVLSGFNSDKDAFKTITIVPGGSSSKTFNASSQWTKVDPDFLSKNKNQVQSENIFLSGKNGASFILLFGTLDGSGYREEFSIIRIKDAKATMILDDRQENDIEIPVEINDLDQDGKTDFVWTRLRETIQEVDSLDADIGSYTPFYVYTLSEDFQLNPALTRQYNELHYVWAGFDSTGNYQVIYPHNGGKLKILKIE